jgi:hypothetical protein
MNRTYDFVMDGAMVHTKNDSETAWEQEGDTQNGGQSQ